MKFIILQTSIILLLILTGKKDSKSIALYICWKSKWEEYHIRYFVYGYYGIWLFRKSDAKYEQQLSNNNTKSSNGKFSNSILFVKFRKWNRK